MTIASTAAPSSGSQRGASVRFSLRPCSRDDDRFSGSAFVWFPARRVRPFLSPSCSRDDDKLARRRRVRVLIALEENAINILPELFPREWPLPWAPFTVRNHTAVCPEGGDLAHGSACAKVADASTSRDVGTSATARSQSASGKSTAGKRHAARPEAARTPWSRTATPRPRNSAACEPKSRPRPLKTHKLRRRVVTRQKIFFPPHLRSARLLPTPCKLTAQPGSLLLRRLPSGRWQRPGPRT
jgi:hypothetical protein